MSALRLVLILTAVLWMASCAPGETDAPAATITPEALTTRIEAGSAPLVLDVRTREEYAQGHIPGARNIPHDELPLRLAELPETKSTEIVVHCHSGRRAAMAEEVLREAGYTGLRDLDGHWQGWHAAGRPSE